MWSKKAVQRNLQTLVEDGHLLVEPEHAPAYEVGTGEMTDTPILPEPDVLVRHLKDLLQQIKGAAEGERREIPEQP